MRRQLFTYLFLIVSLWVGAQESRIEVSVDSVHNSLSKYDQIFSLLSSEKTKINTIYKFNAVDWGQLQPSFSLETSLTPNLSIEPGFRLINFGVKNETGLKYLVEPSFISKYYYNFKRREKLGRETNGFSGNYFFAGFVMPFSDNYDWYSQHLENSYFLYADSPEEDHRTLYSGNLQVGYGIQRRLASIGYIDFRAGYGRSVLSNTPIAKRGNLFFKVGDEAFETRGNFFIKIDIGFGVTKKILKDLINE